MTLFSTILAIALPALATTITGSFFTTSQMGVGTFEPRATLEARAGSSDDYALRVSSSDGTPLFFLDRSGKGGVGMAYPQAVLDVRGSDAPSEIGLMLRAGNSTSTLNSVQIAFGLASTDTYRHSIRTRHNASAANFNSIDFFLWRSTGDPAALGIHHALSLQALHTSSASVHVWPSTSTPNADLEISSGTVLGGGSIRYASFGSHSSRELKTDVSYLGPEDENAAASDIQSLKPVTFRYRGASGAAAGPTRKGFIFEDTPSSIHGSGDSIVIDERLANVELALKAVSRRILAVERKIRELEAAKERSR